jgi:hypothetical protein
LIAAFRFDRPAVRPGGLDLTAVETTPQGDETLDVAQISEAAAANPTL